MVLLLFNFSLFYLFVGVNIIIIILLKTRDNQWVFICIILCHSPNTMRETALSPFYIGGIWNLERFSNYFTARQDSTGRYNPRICLLSLCSKPPHSSAFHCLIRLWSPGEPSITAIYRPCIIKDCSLNIFHVRCPIHWHSPFHVHPLVEFEWQQFQQGSVRYESAFSA